MPAEANLGGKKILIADDCDDIRSLYCSTLRQDGWQTIEASSGQEALDKIVGERPDIVILDQHMPLMRGTEVYKQICEMGLTIPVILVAAESNIASIAHKVGIRHYLGKPTTPEELKNMIRLVRESQGNS